MNKRFNYLVSSCYTMLSREPGYGLTLAGRANKLSYMMRLIDNMPGRAGFVIWHWHAIPVKAHYLTLF